MPYQLTDDDVQILRQMREWQKRLEGPNSSNTPGGASFGATGTGRRPRRNLFALQGSAPQYQGMLFTGLVADTSGWAFAMAVNSVPST